MQQKRKMVQQRVLRLFLITVKILLTYITMRNLLQDNENVAFCRASICPEQSSHGRARTAVPGKVCLQHWPLSGKWSLGIWNWESAREQLAGKGSSLWLDSWHEQMGYAEHLLSSWESEALCAYMTSSENSGCWDSNGLPWAEKLLEVVAFSWLKKE